MTDMDKINGIRLLAEHYVKAYHPDEHAYFDLAWDTIANRPRQGAVSGASRWKWLDKFALTFHKSEGTQLPVAAVTIAAFSIIDELQRNSWRISSGDFVPLIRACAKAAKMPKKEAIRFEEYMAPRIQQHYARFTATAEEVICANIIQAKDSEVFWVWTGDENSSDCEKRRFTKDEVDARYRANRESYDLFLDDGLVSVRQHVRHAGLILKSHMYDILLLLLIRRGEFLTHEELYRRAWAEGDTPSNSMPKTVSDVDPRTYLKTYVKRLRDKFCALPGFDIVTDKGMGGSALRGEFRFCVVLPAAKAGRFIAPLSK
jgi:hypothetical protein